MVEEFLRSAKMIPDGSEISLEAERRWANRCCAVKKFHHKDTHLHMQFFVTTAFTKFQDSWCTVKNYEINKSSGKRVFPIDGG